MPCKADRFADLTVVAFLDDLLSKPTPPFAAYPESKTIPQDLLVKDIKLAKEEVKVFAERDVDGTLHLKYTHGCSTAHLHLPMIPVHRISHFELHEDSKAAGGIDHVAAVKPIHLSISGRPDDRFVMILQKMHGSGEPVVNPKDGCAELHVLELDHKQTSAAPGVNRVEVALGAAGAPSQFMQLLYRECETLTQTVTGMVRLNIARVGVRFVVDAFATLALD
jgi:hypothetical protein